MDDRTISVLPWKAPGYMVASKTPRDTDREVKRLRAENERLPHELAASRANLQALWQALALIRDAIEELAPAGAMRSSEAVMGAEGREPHHEAEELVRGIQAIVADRRG